MHDFDTYHVYGIEVEKDEHAWKTFKTTRKTFLAAIEMIRIQTFNGELIGNLEALRVHRDYRKHGYAHQIQNYMVQQVAPSLSLKQLLYNTPTVNLPSIRVAVTSGMHEIYRYSIVMISNDASPETPFLAFTDVKIPEYIKRVENALKVLIPTANGELPTLIQTSSKNDISSALGCIPNGAPALFQAWKMWENSRHGIEILLDKPYDHQIIFGHCSSLKRKEHSKTCSIANYRKDDSGNFLMFSIYQPEQRQEHMLEDFLIHIYYWLTADPSIRSFYLSFDGKYTELWQELSTFDLVPRKQKCEILFSMDLKKTYASPQRNTLLKSGFRVRKLNEDDLSKVEDATKGVFGGYDWIIPAFKNKWFKYPEIFHPYCLEQNGSSDKIAALELIRIDEFHGEKVGNLEGLRVHADYRGQGIGHIIQSYMTSVVAPTLELKQLYYCTTSENKGSTSIALRSGMIPIRKMAYIMISNDPDETDDLFAFPGLGPTDYFKRVHKVLSHLTNQEIPANQNEHSILTLTAEKNDINAVLKHLPEDYRVLYQDWKIFERSEKAIQKLINDSNHEIMIGQCSLVHSIENAPRVQVCSIGYFRNDEAGPFLILTMYPSSVIGLDASPETNKLLAIDMLAHMHFWLSLKPNLSGCYFAYDDKLRGVYKVFCENDISGGKMPQGVETRYEAIFNKTLQ